MSRKVLISFLGTGPFESKETRTYKTARYHIGETDLGEYPFVSAALRKYFSSLMNLNHLHAIQSISQRLSAVKSKSYQTQLPQLTINPIVETFINRFNVSGQKHSLFQLKVARWQLDHRKYAQAMLTINESMVTYVCEQNNLQWDDFDSREFAKMALSYHPEARMLKCDKSLKQIYKKLRPLRNSTAHSLVTTKSVKDMIKALTDCVLELESIIQ